MNNEQVPLRGVASRLDKPGAHWHLRTKLNGLLSFRRAHALLLWVAVCVCGEHVAVNFEQRGSFWVWAGLLSERFSYIVQIYSGRWKRYMKTLRCIWCWKVEWRSHTFQIKYGFVWTMIQQDSAQVLWKVSTIHVLNHEKSMIHSLDSNWFITILEHRRKPSLYILFLLDLHFQSNSTAWVYLLKELWHGYLLWT